MFNEHDDVPQADVARQSSDGTGAISGFIRSRLGAGHPPGKIALDLERIQPGLGRALLGSIQTAAAELPSTTSARNIPVATSVAPSQPPMLNRASFVQQAPGRRQAVLPQSAGRIGGTNSNVLSSPTPKAKGLLDPFRSEQGGAPVYEAAYRPNDKNWGPGLGGYNVVKKIALKKHPEITGNVRSIIQQMTGSAFNNSDMEKLSREIIDNITLDQGKEFENVVRSKRGTLILRPAQWEIVHEILSGLPEDDLGTRVRDAFAKAKSDGKIRHIKVSVDPYPDPK